MDSPLVLRPFRSFSPERWETAALREEGLREEGEVKEEVEDVRRTCDAESALLRQGIFSKLTTGSDTLRRSGEERRESEDSV